MKLAVSVVCIAVAIYLVIVLFLFVSQRSLLYRPSVGKISPAEFGVPEMRSINLKTKDGLALLAWYKPPTDPENLTLLYLHGNAGHIGYRATKVKPFLDRGFGVLLLSYRGYGPNQGSPTEENLYLDGHSGLQFLASQQIPISKVVIYGESLGSGVAVELAQNKAISALILEAPFTSMAETAHHHFRFLPTNFLLRDKYDSINKLINIDTRLLILHGKKDQTVPFKLGKKLFEAAPGQKDFYEFSDAGHNDLYDHGAAERIIGYLYAGMPGKASLGPTK